MFSEFDYVKYVKAKDEDIKFKNKNKKKKKKEFIISGGLDIVKIPSASTEFKLRPAMKAGAIPAYPKSTTIIGQTGSGKTNVLINMFCNKDMYAGYFDLIYLFAATGDSDSLFEYLNLDEEFIITSNMSSKLSELLRAREKECDEKGPQNCEKLAIIFEDVSANKDILNSIDYALLHTQNRHLGISIFSCSHKWKAIPRICRLQCNNILLFGLSRSDLNQFIEDTIPAGLTKNEYNELIEEATTPDKEHVRPYLYVNNDLPIRDRYRKTFKTKLIF